MQKTDDMFRVLIKRQPQAKKVLFYLTSFKFPWWVFWWPIRRFHRHGYEVVVYEFADQVIENDDPQITLDAIRQIIADIAHRFEAYELQGASQIDGVGNSLGSYILCNAAKRLAFAHLVLNGVGSVVGVIFDAKRGPLKKVRSAYKSKGVTRSSLQKLWQEIDGMDVGNSIKAERLYIQWSLHDGLIPRASSEEFIASAQRSTKPVRVTRDKKSHNLSILSHAYKVRPLLIFLEH